jgi:hypothetical protein
MNNRYFMSRTPTDWAVWLPKGFFLNWSDKDSRERNMADPTIWLPLGLFPPVERERLVNNYYNYYGDMFENITDSTISSKSIVQNSFNKVEMKYGEETKQALDEVSRFIGESMDPAAIALFNSFLQELNKPQYEKSALKGILNGIVKVLPSISNMPSAVAKITTLFK